MSKKLWILRKDFRFEASHQLMFHDGKCARLHGHSWIMTVELAGEQLQSSIGYEGAGHNPKLNMLMDYGDIKSIVQPFIETHLDHWHLNDTLTSNMPTSEWIAQFCFGFLHMDLPELRAIEISETCTSFCRYEGIGE